MDKAFLKWSTCVCAERGSVWLRFQGSQKTQYENRDVNPIYAILVTHQIAIVYPEESVFLAKASLKYL
jgi:hypothetical protein